MPRSSVRLGRRNVPAVLMEDEPGDLSRCVALEADPGIDDLQEELVLGGSVYLDLALPGGLREKAPVFHGDGEYERGLQRVIPGVFAEGLERQRDFLGQRRGLAARGALHGAVLMEIKRDHVPGGIPLE